MLPQEMEQLLQGGGGLATLGVILKGEATMPRAGSWC